ncbi:MAG: hypothetical protein A3E37_02305 [Candidatus Andersenbacteria bacterium RIFCSPHIGHO2_12_FULL_46_9]|nr:MAG: hypothetical protein A3B76_06340 [Candidatus Andersenbacteria bacterium RIFCSPHIGHO2_02_FULL_46_16]OGY36373.1 MAG: hypothetical protein A3E37_02305 [Candidatus Andersenbacteria bacterium RIFCSPHIGHO2_12_FULL_46_9]OGY37866.1 MAG: hypothetical protein A3I08_01595 [Candidatus Andersenbacteria bacterium RIFCSPLOWO2_02_FULL_46_11]OGY42662.1 MAG: hypothetical protein A3G57_03435 [Candidatus Andersenbacteria bacterium RIFCSPLOWO2_12_FULL_45_8]HBE90256.1 hypothetical protein [Candidatus Anderse
MNLYGDSDFSFEVVGDGIWLTIGGGLKLFFQGKSAGYFTEAMTGILGTLSRLNHVISDFPFNPKEDD